VGDIQQGTTSEGVHLGAMAGTVDLVQRVSTGIETKGDVSWLNPELPPDLERLGMRIRYRGHSIDLRLTRLALTVQEHGREAVPISLGVAGKVYEFASGTTRVLQLNGEMMEQASPKPDRPGPMAEGKLAATNGGATASNPYPKDTEEHAKWLEGYQDALDAEDDGMASDFA